MTPYSEDTSKATVQRPHMAIWHPQPACPFIIRDQKVIEFGGMSSLHREHQGHGSMPPSSLQPTCCIPKFFASPNVPIRKIEWSWLRSLPPPVVERLPRPCFNAHLWHLSLLENYSPACLLHTSDLPKSWRKIARSRRKNE